MGSGNLMGGIADMSVLDEHLSDCAVHLPEALRNARLLITDGNILPDSLMNAKAACDRAGIDMWFEATSVPKIKRAANSLQGVHLIKLNVQELEAIVEELGVTSPPVTGDHVHRVQELAAIVFKTLHVGILLVSFGKQGVFLLRQEPFGVMEPRFLKLQLLPDMEPLYVLQNLSGPHCISYELKNDPVNIENYNGCGDALVAGMAAAVSNGHPLEDAVFLGLSCAQITLTTSSAVSPRLSPDLLTLGVPSPSAQWNANL